MVTRFLVSAALISFLYPAASFAEFICGAEISYEWKRAQAENPVSVSAGSVQEKGADEASAKSRLSVLVKSRLTEVRAECRREHENLSGCIAAKYAASAAVLQNLGFNARKALEEAISSDCKAQQGVCKEPQASEPVCREEAAPTASTPAGAAQKEEPKVGKKK